MQQSVKEDAQLTSSCLLMSSSSVLLILTQGFEAERTESVHNAQDLGSAQ